MYSNCINKMIGDESPMINSVRLNATYFWKISLILLCLIGLSTGLMSSAGFWTSYVLDIAGPAWCYILIRAQYKSTGSTFLSIKFTPEIAAILIVGICAIIETSQYFHLYDAHFDPYDYLAYVSGVIPFYIIDKWNLTIKKKNLVSLL